MYVIIILTRSDNLFFYIPLAVIMKNLTTLVWFIREHNANDAL